MKKELLEKVNREYFEVREDGYVEFKPERMVQFINAFIREVVYKKMKNEFFSNPKIIFMTEPFNKYNVNMDVHGKISKYYHGYYKRPDNIIVINVCRIEQASYNYYKMILNHETEGQVNKKNKHYDRI